MNNTEKQFIEILSKAIRKDDNSEKWTGYGMPWCGTSGEYINRKVRIRT